MVLSKLIQFLPVHPKARLRQTIAATSRPSLLLRRQRQWHDDRQDDRTRSRQCRSSGQEQDPADADTQNFDLRTGQVCATGRRYYCRCHQLARQTPLLSQLDAKIAGASMMTSYCRVYLVVVFVDNTAVGSILRGQGVSSLLHYNQKLILLSNPVDQC